jgi:hypothetical protein
MESVGQMLEDIKAQEAVLKSVEELWRETRYHEIHSLRKPKTMRSG